MVDYWAHRHAEEPDLRKEEYDPDFEAECAKMDDLPDDLPIERAPEVDDYETIFDDKLE